MRACFCDNVDLPIECSHDIDEVYNCEFATKGIPRDNCPHWNVDRAVRLARDILGITQIKQCFGPECAGCEDFFACEEHWGKHYICED